MSEEVMAILQDMWDCILNALDLLWDLITGGTT